MEVPSETQFDYFGSSIAISGSTAAVGTPGRLRETGPAGSGYVWVLNRDGQHWRPSAQVAPFGSDPVEDFGLAVALSAETLLVSARESVYVYERSGEAWVPKTRLRLSPFQTSGGELFGMAVAVSGDVIAVGAPGEEFCQILPCHSNGQVHVYRRINDVWTYSDILNPDTEYWTPGSFGAALALNEQSLVVGNPGLNQGRGAVSVFPREPNAWGEPTLLEPSVDTPGLAFGAAVALADDLVVVGAPGNIGFPSVIEGRAYLFRQQEGAWMTDGEIDAPTPIEQSEFGAAVAVYDGRVAIGGDNSAGNPIVGVYEKQMESWVELGRVSPEQEFERNIGFGWAVALGQGTILVGAPGDSDAMQTQLVSGAIYAYRPGLFASDFEGIE